MKNIYRYVTRQYYYIQGHVKEKNIIQRFRNMKYTLNETNK